MFVLHCNTAQQYTHAVQYKQYNQAVFSVLKSSVHDTNVAGTQ